MGPRAYLALDLGASAGRAIVGVLENGRVELHEVHRFEHAPGKRSDGLFWNLGLLWDSLRIGLRAAAEWTRARAVPLVSVGVDTWGVDFALVNAAGAPPVAPRCYRDPRNEDARRELLAQIAPRALYDRTGIQIMPLNTIFQLAAMKRTEPQYLANMDRLLFMPDLMHSWLSEQLSNERTIASTSQLLDARTGDWSFELIESLGLPKHLFGPLSRPGAVLGRVRPQLALEADLDPAPLVVLPAGHDTACAVAAVPADPRTRWCYLSSGTWSLLGAEIAAPCLSDAAYEAPFTNERGLGGTIRFLKNITGLWLVQECRRALATDGAAPADYEQLFQAAARAAPFRTLVNPDDPPFAQPGDMPVKIAAFAQRTGQPAPRDTGELIRACLDSLVLTYRRTLRQLEAALGWCCEVLHVVGGGSRHTLLNQMTADATGIPVLAGPQEATALGNVLIQALGDGQVSDPAALRRVVAASFEPLRFEPRNPAMWDEPAERFERLVARSADP